MIFAIMGCNWKSRKAPRKIVTLGMIRDAMLASRVLGDSRVRVAESTCIFRQIEGFAVVGKDGKGCNLLDL
jgi:hypothetical protein